MHERGRCSGGCACHAGALAQAGQPHLVADLLSLLAAASGGRMLSEFRRDPISPSLTPFGLQVAAL